MNLSLWWDMLTLGNLLSYIYLISWGLLLGGMIPSLLLPDSFAYQHELKIIGWVGFALNVTMMLAIRKMSQPWRKKLDR